MRNIEQTVAGKRLGFAFEGERSDRLDAPRRRAEVMAVGDAGKGDAIRLCPRALGSIVRKSGAKRVGRRCLPRNLAEC